MIVLHSRFCTFSMIVGLVKTLQHGRSAAANAGEWVVGSHLTHSTFLHVMFSLYLLAFLNQAASANWLENSSMIKTSLLSAPLNPFGLSAFRAFNKADWRVKLNK